MSDNQRRIIARLAFLFLCLLPTSFVVYQLFHQPTTTDWQNMIQAKLGWNVEIDSLETPLPGTTIFHGIKVLSSAGEIPAKLNKATLIGGDRRQLIVDQPVELSPTAFAKLFDQCNKQFTTIGFDNHPWQIIFRSGITVVSDNDTSGFGVVLKPAQIDIQKHDGWIFAAMQTRIPNQETQSNSEQPNVITCTIAQSLVGNRKHVELDTGPTGYLPCQFASSWIDEVRLLGDQSYFSGQLSLHIDSSKQKNGSARGSILNVQLEDLVRQYDHRLDGIGNVTQLNCQIVDGRIKTISGNIKSAYPGYVGLSMLHSAQRHLGIHNYGNFNSQVVEFAGFDFDWEIADGQLKISKADHGVIAFDSEGKNMLVCPSDQQPIPLPQFAEFLVQPRGDSRLHDETMLVLRRFHHPSRRTADLDSTTVDPSGQYR